MTDSPRRPVSQLSEDEGFLSRWSRRKLSQGQPPVVQTLEQPAQIATPDSVSPQADARPDEPATPQAPLTDADMPPLETLADDSDYSGFLSSEVSRELRRLALRRMFRSHQYQTPCNLIEYGGNYTNFLPLGDTVTADMRHRLAQEALRRAAEGLEEESLVPRAEAVAASQPAPTDPPASTPDDEQSSAGHDRQENP